MLFRSRLGVRRRYGDDLRLDSRFAKTGWQWCHVLVRDDVRLDSRYAKTGWQWCHVLVSASVVATATMSASTRVTLRQGGILVTCLSRRPSVATATTSASTRVNLR